MPNGDGEDKPGNCPFIPLIYDPGQEQTAPTVTISTPATTNVAVAAAETQGAVNTITLTATGTPNGGTYTWSSNNSNVTLTMANTATVTIQGVAQGASDITVTYALNGEDDTADQTIQVQQPNSTKLNTDSGNKPYACHYQNGTVAYTGVQRTVGYQLFDAATPPVTIAINGIPMVESFAMQNDGCGVGTPSVGNGPTTSGGKFGDEFLMCAEACDQTSPSYAPNCTTTITHTWTANGFPVFNHILTYACQSIVP